MSNLRRLMMMAGRGGGYLEGWIDFTTLTTKGEETSAETLMCSPYLDKGEGAISVTWTTGGGGRACYYDSNYVFKDYWNLNVATRNVPATVRYIRISFPMANIDNCSVYDNTNHRYIFKGKNV